jgi:tetratricopeptide (TPR) repeat protein
MGHYKEALKLARENSDHEQEAVTLNRIGLIAAQQGDFLEGQKAFDESLELMRDLGSVVGQGATLVNMGRACLLQNNLQRALSYLNDALERLREAGDQNGIAGALNDRGFIFYRQGNFDAALEEFNASRQIAQLSGNRLAEVLALWNIGELKAAQGYFEEARSLYTDALSFYEMTRSTVNIAKLRTKLAQLDGLMQHPDLTRQFQQIVEQIESSTAIAGSLKPIVVQQVQQIQGAKLSDDDTSAEILQPLLTSLAALAPDIHREVTQLVA